MQRGRHLHIPRGIVRCPRSRLFRFFRHHPDKRNICGKAKQVESRCRNWCRLCCNWQLHPVSRYPLPLPPLFLGNFEKIGKTSCENTTHVVRFWGHRFGSVRFGSVRCNALRCGSLGSLGSLGLFPIFLFSSFSALPALLFFL